MEMRMKVRMLRTDRGVRQAIYILNRVPTRALEDKTPYEALYNRKPNLENLRIFRCTAYAKITIPHLKKLDDRSIPMIYLGIEEGSKACEEDTSTQDTFWTSFVVEGVDNENATPVNIELNDNIDNPYQEQDPINDPNLPITPSTYTYNPHSKEEEEATTSSTKNSGNIFDHVPDPINDPNSPITPSTYTYNPHSEEEENATTSSTKNSGNIFDHVPVRGFKDLAEIYQNTQEVETETLLFMEEEPCNYKEASTYKKWIEAMEIELDSINKNNTWTLTTFPPDQKAIGLK
nr:zinc finger, CCHC-type [Tanacetum cinerariifolium]